MGRGLSDLQQAILLMAYNNRMNEGRHHGSKGFDLYFAEVLEQYYHFDARYEIRAIRWDGYHDGASGYQCFDRERIGAERYNAAQAATSRAIRRLEDRGLIKHMSWAYHKGRGLDLTASGIETAEKLTVNDGSLRYNINRNSGTRPAPPQSRWRHSDEREDNYAGDE